MNKKDTAIVLLSGGIDSSTSLAIAQDEGYEVVALSFDYKQRHEREIVFAKCYASTRNIEQHIISRINLSALYGFGGSALTQKELDVPTNRSANEMNAEIPITYVPARNTIFLGFAAALAEVKQASAIYIGVNALDYSGYPDCRPEYIEAYQNMLNLATRQAVEDKEFITIKTPLIHLTKGEIIQRGLDLDVQYQYTLSCYNPDPTKGPCKVCDSCILRAKGFAEVGIEDPALTQ